MISTGYRDRGGRLVLDDTGGLRCFGPLSNRPCPYFLRTAGEVPDELKITYQHPVNVGGRDGLHQTAISGLRYLGQSALRSDLLLLLLLSLLATCWPNVPLVTRRKG